MFASQHLAARIDRAEGRLCAGIARELAARAPELGAQVFEIAGGVAVFAGSGSPSNKMIGVGFDGVPRDEELARVEGAFAHRHAPLQAEISTLADPALHECLVRRGYQARGFENVLGHPMTDLEIGASDIVIQPARQDQMRDWAEVVVTAFGSPDAGGVGGDAIPPADELRRWVTLTMGVPGFDAFLVRLDGQLVGGGALRLDEGIAQFCGAATLPAFRRRGVQTALVRYRLAHARRAGCDVAVVTTQPASRSQENVQRQGFHLLYARQLLVKPPPS